MKRFLRKPSRLALEWFAVAVFVCIVLPILFMLYPVRRIRIACILSDRIGHISADVDLLMRKNQLHGSPARTSYIFLCGEPVANEQLVKMWKRRLTIVRSRILQYLWLHRLSGIAAHTPFIEPMSMHSDEHYEFAMGEPSIEFTHEEKKTGWKLLRDIGVPEGAWYVCIHARDPAYIGTREGFGEQNKERSFLDCSIEDFADAARLITGRGGYVLRMGASVEAPMPDLGPGVIDYATRHRSDFLDIFIPRNCRFFLGCASGLFGIPLMFNVPLAITNYCPYIFRAPGRNTLYQPKLLRNRSTGELQEFRSLQQLGLLDGDLGKRRTLRDAKTYENLDLEWIDNTPDEIAGLCQDMLDQLDGKPACEEAILLQEAFSSLYSGPNASPHAGKIGPAFARAHHSLISPVDNGAASGQSLQAL